MLFQEIEARTLILIKKKLFFLPPCFLRFLGDIRNSGGLFGCGRLEGEMGFFSPVFKVCSRQCRWKRWVLLVLDTLVICLSPPPFSMKSDEFLGNAFAEEFELSLSLSVVGKRREWLLAPGAAIYDQMGWESWRLLCMNFKNATVEC